MNAPLTVLATPSPGADLRADDSTPTPSPWPEGWLEIESLDLEAQGVARKPDGKVVFIDGALPTELVSAQTTRSVMLSFHWPPGMRVSGGAPAGSIWAKTKVRLKSWPASCI